MGLSPKRDFREAGGFFRLEKITQCCIGQIERKPCILLRLRKERGAECRFAAAGFSLDQPALDRDEAGRGLRLAHGLRRILDPRPLGGDQRKEISAIVADLVDGVRVERPGEVGLVAAAGAELLLLAERDQVGVRERHARPPGHEVHVDPFARAVIATGFVHHAKRVDTVALSSHYDPAHCVLND